MSSTASSPAKSLPLHTLISNVGCLASVAVFLEQMWSRASLEHTLFVAAGVGLGVYFILAVGYAAARAVIAYDPAEEEADASEEAGGGAGPEGADPEEAESEEAESEEAEAAAEATAGTAAGAAAGAQPAAAGAQPAA